MVAWIALNDFVSVQIGGGQPIYSISRIFLTSNRSCPICIGRVKCINSPSYRYTGQPWIISRWLSFIEDRGRSRHRNDYVGYADMTRFILHLTRMAVCRNGNGPAWKAEARQNTWTGSTPVTAARFFYDGRTKKHVDGWPSPDDGIRLESESPRKGTAGSNPAPSANFEWEIKTKKWL